MVDTTTVHPDTTNKVSKALAEVGAVLVAGKKSTGSENVIPDDAD